MERAKLSLATVPPQRSNKNISTKNAQKKNLLLIFFLENFINKDPLKLGQAVFTLHISYIKIGF